LLKHLTKLSAPVEAIQPMSEMLDLPAAPLVTTGAASEVSRHAPVVAHLLDGRELRGLLEQFDRESATIRVAVAGAAGQESVPFSALRYLVFPSPLPPADAPHPLVATGLPVKMPEEAQAFSISFADGKHFSGRTRGSMVEDDGLHLFPVLAHGDVVRMFVPRCAVVDYRIGANLAEALVRAGAVDPLKLEKAVRSQEALRDMLGQTRPQPAARLGQMLLHAGLITQRQLEQALRDQASQRAKNLGDALVQMGAISSEAYHSILARNLGLPFVKLQGFKPEAQVLDLVDPDFARRHRMMPLMMHDDRLVVAMEDPTNYESINLLRFTTGRNIEVAVATGEDIEQGISNLYASQRTEAVLDEIQIQAVQTEEMAPALNTERFVNEKPLVRLVNELLLEAIRRRASDIHIRPAEDHVDVLFRIDGALTDIRRLPKAMLPAVISRLKILADMDIAEKRMPQDGQMRAIFEGNVVDMRVSAMPTVTGESMVIRVLNTKTGLKPISELGFSQRDEALIKDMLNKSTGMILVTGPTGSGKSTTLYAALNEVRKRNVNIITVENPVEYHIEGIMQIQVKAQIGYTFAEALRHILRHDPDVILIGEIRDQETAHIAIKSALTGHLVLSTLHTNDAASAITRLRDMEIETYLLGPTLIGIMAQRLIRKNCRHCMEVEQVDDHVRTILGVADEEVFYRGCGCEHCNHTGYSGRMAVYELLAATPTIQKLIADGASTEVIHAQAVKEGMVPLTENALSLARQRSTSLAEVYRVRLE